VGSLGFRGAPGLRLSSFARLEQPALRLIQSIVGGALLCLDSRDRRPRLLLARFLGALDLFTIWWAVVLGIGVAVLSGRRARNCAAWLVSAYVGIALVLAAVMASAA
jgi:hypothetical protein